MSDSHPNHSRPWGLIGFLAFVALAIALGGYGFYREQERSIREAFYKEMKVIAELKVNQILSWRRERLTDALLHSTGIVRLYVLQWLKAPDDTAVRKRLQARLQDYRELQGYENVILAAPDGRVLLSLDPAVTGHDSIAKELVGQVVSQQREVFGDFFLCPVCNQVHLDIAAPILDEEGTPAVVMILRVDPHEYLYPLIQMWPTPSRSAETLLTRREGEEVLYLNPLRHRPDSPLTFRLPLAWSELPTSQATLGKFGPLEGRDYRGVPVLTEVRPVPGSPWFMVAKVDAEEFLSEVRFRSAVVVCFTLTLMLLVVAGAGFLYKHRGKRMFQALYRAERERREAHEEIRATLYGIGDAVIATNDRGRITRMNPVAEALTGWTEAEALGQPLSRVFRIVDEVTRAEVKNPVDRILDDGMVVGIANHTLLVARDGTERPVADSGAPIRNEEGEIIGVVLVFRDQTEDRSRLKALRESEDRVRSVLRAAPTGIGLAKDRVILEVNDRLCDMTGYSREELVGTGARMLYPTQEDYDYVGREKYGQIARMGTGAVETRWLRKDGTVIDVLLASTPLDLNDLSRGVTFTALDITERKRNEDELRKLYRAVEQSPASVVVTDLQGNIQYVNPKFTAVTGYSLEEVLGQNPRILKSGETSLEEYRKLWETITSGGEWRGVFRNKRKDGSLFWERAAISPIRDAAGVITHFLGVKEDITSQKALEEQLQQAQKLEAVGRLAGGVAHDFNNMLGVITGHVEMALLRTGSDDPIRRDLLEIQEAGRRSSELVRRLLAFARRQAVAPIVLNLNEAVSGMVKILQRLIGEDIELQWLPEPDLWPVKVDPTQIDQLLANLAVNARDAIGGVGKVTIRTANVVWDESRCAAHAESLPGEYVLLEVGDNGCGMDRETLGCIFEPFFTTKGSGEGTGLGLSTVYGIVKQNGGFITVRSEPGQGTDFGVYLPRFEPQSAEVSPESPVDPVRGGTETVLLVEDEWTMLQMGRSMLQSLGYRVLAAGTPGEALRLAAEESGFIHLLVTDVVMPDMNGRDLAERLQSIRPGLKCLFMSGYTADIVARYGVVNEGIHFIQKPFSLHTLGTRVRDVLDRSGQ